MLPAEKPEHEFADNIGFRSRLLRWGIVLLVAVGILLTTHLMWQGLMANLIEARQNQGPLFDYLAIEVLDQQPEPLRQFLLESAVLPEMEPQLFEKHFNNPNATDGD